MDITSDNIEAILIDGDDTLWYDHRYFRLLVRDLFEKARLVGLSRREAKACFEPAMTSCEPGETGFVRAVRAAALAMDVSVEESIDRFLQHPTELLPGAAEFLRVRSRWRRVLWTKGVRSEQERKLERSGLRDSFDHVAIVAKKSSSTLMATLSEIGVRADTCVLIGNNIEDDIIPARKTGLFPVWLNHPENLRGRNQPLPQGVPEFQGWGELSKHFGLPGLL